MKGRQKPDQPLTQDEAAAMRIQMSTIVMENQRMANTLAAYRQRCTRQAEEIEGLRAEVQHLAQFKPPAPVEIPAGQKELFQ